MPNTLNKNDVQALFTAHYAKLVLYASRFLDEEEAEDVVQTVFVDLWEKRERHNNEEQIKSYLYKAVYSRALNVIRHRQSVRKHEQYEQGMHDMRVQYYTNHHSDAIKRIENEELMNTIQEAVDQLPKKCRDVFMLSYFRQFGNDEIADVLDISKKTVEAHKYKALKHLRAVLKGALLIVLLFSLLKQL